MTERNTALRAMHDVGLAAWFGGTLMGAVGLNGAAAAVPDPRQRSQAASAGWAKWTPVNAAAIGAHLVGATGLLLANRGRLTSQQGVAANSAAKAALTGAALAVTGYARVLGKKIEQNGTAPTEGPTDPGPGTPDDVAKAQRQQKLIQWVIPALTGGILVLNSLQGEQQRPSQVAAGTVQRLKSLVPFTD